MGISWLNTTHTGLRSTGAKNPLVTGAAFHSNWSEENEEDDSDTGSQ